MTARNPAEREGKVAPGDPRGLAFASRMSHSQYQELREEAKLHLEEIQSRLQFAWQKAWLLLDLWEPQFLANLSSFLERLCQFLEREVERLSHPSRLSAVFRSLAEIPTLGTLVSNIEGAIFTADSSDAGNIARRLIECAPSICYLAGLVFLHTKVDPSVENSFKQLLLALRAVGIQLEVRPQTQFPVSPPEYEFWEFRGGPNEDSVRVESLRVSLKPVFPRPEPGKSLPAETYIHAVFAPAELGELLEKLWTFLEERVTPEMEQRLGVPGQGLGPKRMLRKFFEACQANRSPGEEYKRQAFELLNAIWQEIGVQGQFPEREEVAQAPPAAQSKVQERGISPGLSAAGSPKKPPERGTATAYSGRRDFPAGEKPVDTLWDLLRLWQEFCERVLQISIKPRVSHRERKLHLDGFKGYPLTDIKLKGTDESSLEVSVGPCEIVAVKSETGSPGEVVSLDRFWCHQFPARCRWKAKVPGSSEYWEIATLPPLEESLLPQGTVSSLREWQKWAGILLLDPNCQQASKQFEKLKSALRQDFESGAGEAGECLQEFLRVASGLKQAPDKIARTAAVWGKALESFLGLRWYPPIDWDANRLSDQPLGWEVLEQAASRCTYNSANPLGRVVSVERFSTTEKGARFTVSLGARGDNAYVDASSALLTSAHEVSQLFRKSAKEVPRWVLEAVNLCSHLLRLEVGRWGGGGVPMEPDSMEDSLATALENLLSVLQQATNLQFSSEDVSAKLGQFAESIKEWAQVHGFEIIPHEFEIVPRHFKFQFVVDDLTPEERNFCGFEFDENLLPGEVQAVVEKFGWRHRYRQDLKENPRMVVKIGPPRGYQELQRAFAQAVDAFPGHKEKLSVVLNKPLSLLNAWPERLSGTREANRKREMISLILYFYKELTLSLRDLLPEEIEGIWEQLRSPMEVLLRDYDLRFWEPRSLLEAKDETKCVLVGPFQRAPNKFKVLMPGLSQGDALVATATVWLYRE